MRLLVTGDRNWMDALVVDGAFDQFILDNDLLDVDLRTIVLICGMARGADTVCHVVGQLWGFAIEEYPADWTGQGRRAGPIRNQQMLDSGVDYVLAFHDDIQNSRGTADMLQRCRDAGIPGKLYLLNGDSGDYTEFL